MDDSGISKIERNQVFGQRHNGNMLSDSKIFNLGSCIQDRLVRSGPVKPLTFVLDSRI